MHKLLLTYSVEKKNYIFGQANFISFSYFHYISLPCSLSVSLTHTHIHIYTHFLTCFHVFYNLIYLNLITYLFHIRLIHDPSLVQSFHAVAQSVKQVNQYAEKQPDRKPYPRGRVQLRHEINVEDDAQTRNEWDPRHLENHVVGWNDVSR